MRRKPSLRHAITHPLLPLAGSFEYTFSNRELEDVLGFIERRQSGVPGGEDAESCLPLLGPAAPQLALQFQVSAPRNAGPCLKLRGFRQSTTHT